MDTVSSLFGIKPPDTSAQDAAILAANKAASLEKSDAEADAEVAKQRAGLTIGARGRRGLLAYADRNNLSSSLG